MSGKTASILPLDVIPKGKWYHLFRRTSGQNLSDLIGKPQCHRKPVAINARIVVQLGQAKDIGENYLNISFTSTNINQQRVRNLLARIGAKSGDKTPGPKVRRALITNVRQSSE